MLSSTRSCQSYVSRMSVGNKVVCLSEIKFICSTEFSLHNFLICIVKF